MSPAVLKGMTRAEMIALCIWNDPNGCYTDAENINEFGDAAPDQVYIDVISGWVGAGDMSEQWIAEWLGTHRARPENDYAWQSENRLRLQEAGLTSWDESEPYEGEQS